MPATRYKPKMLMDFIKMNVQKLNIPKLIHACERHYHWEHAVFLYMHYDEYDQAANTMMAHSPIAFAHDQPGSNASFLGWRSQVPHDHAEGQVKK